MEWLAGWLKQIIFVVLLATFVDLLLPNQSMQRYVKLVLSLFVLLTILSPLMQLLGTSVNLRILAAGVDGWPVSGMRETAAGGGAWPGDTRLGAIPALGEVLDEGEELARQRNAQSLSMLKERLESMTEEHVADRFGLNGTKAEASVAIDAEGFPVIHRIAIRVGAGENPEPEPEQEQAREERRDPIVIEPIRIDVSGGDQGGQRGQDRGGTSAVEDVPPAAQKAQLKEIAGSVAALWNIEPGRVSVTGSGGGS